MPDSEWTKGELDSWYYESGYENESVSIASILGRDSWAGYSIEQKATIRRDLAAAGRYILYPTGPEREPEPEPEPLLDEAGWSSADQVRMMVTLPDGSQIEERLDAGGRWIRPLLFGAAITVGILILALPRLFGRDDSTSVERPNDVEIESPAGQSSAPLVTQHEVSDEPARSTNPSDSISNTSPASTMALDGTDSTLQTSSTVPSNAIPAAKHESVEYSNDGGIHTVTVNVEGDGQSLYTAPSTMFYNVLFTIETPGGAFNVTTAARDGEFTSEVAGSSTRPIDGSAVAAEWADASTLVFTIINPENGAGATAIQSTIGVGVQDGEGIEHFFDDQVTWRN